MIVLVRKKLTSIYMNDVLQQRDNIHVLEADVADAASMKVNVFLRLSG